MEIVTHRRIDPDLCGSPCTVAEGAASVTLTAAQKMAADDTGLVHGGFVFGLADYAAMLAVNHPHVVLAAADVKFLKPVKVGDFLTAQAVVRESSGKKRVVDVEVKKEETSVFSGTFACFVLENHVLGDTGKG